MAKQPPPPPPRICPQCRGLGQVLVGSEMKPCGVCGGAGTI